MFTVATAAGALNVAAYCAYQGLPLPLLLVCEDNGIGISVRTPAGWIESASTGRPGVKYFSADGADLEQAYEAASAAAGPEVYQSPNVDRVIAAWPHEPAPERIAALTQRRNQRLAALAAHKAAQNDKS